MKTTIVRAVAGCALFFMLPIGYVNASLVSNVDLVFLQKKLEQSGNVSIIVEYASPFTMSKSVHAMDVVNKRKAINSMREQFKASLSASAKNAVMHDYAYMPASVLNVDHQAFAELKHNPQVKAVYRNRISKALLAESVDIVFAGHETSAYQGGNEWAVAVLDTGVDKAHSFLKTGSVEKVVSEACYSGGGQSGSEFNILCPSNRRETVMAGSGMPCIGYEGCEHGTHVAGIAAGNGTVSDSAGFGGVASDASLIAIQVFTGISDIANENICGTGVGENCIGVFDSDLLKGLERVYALRNTHKIAAVNLSLGSERYYSDCSAENSLITGMIDQLKSAGIVTIVATGNSGYADSMAFPACIGSAIAVGATADFTGVKFGQNMVKDKRTFYSNLSAQIDMYAPGTTILSSVPGGGYARIDGTSMAAPHVSGAFAVLRHAKPSASVAEIEYLLKDVGPDVVSMGITAKRLDVAAALSVLSVKKVVISPILQLLLE